MITPNPIKFICPDCGYEKTVRPQSDALDIKDFMQICPKCKISMVSKDEQGNNAFGFKKDSSFK